MDAWLARARDILAEEAGVAPAELELDDATVATLLDLARIAAHTSGDRRNAPLLCYLAGRAGPGAPLDVLAARLTMGTGTKAPPGRRGGRAQRTS